MGDEDIINCFLCKKQIEKSEKRYGVFDLGKEGIVIPSGMQEKNLICNECYHKERSQYQKSNTYVGENVRGVTIHDKVLTPEEIKAMYEMGPPSFDDNEPHIISHKDEDEGYLWIDGKRVKKNDLEDSK